MAYTFKNIKIVDKSSPWNGKRVDLIVDRGRIHEIGRNLSTKGKSIEGKGLHLSPGWIDMHMHIPDPGMEFKEDIQSGLAAARSGGFTSVVLMPGTTPVVDSKGQIEYLMTRSQRSGVKVYPAAAMSKGMQGKELSEMVDLSSSGARIFADDKRSIASGSLLTRALHYAYETGRRVSSFPLDAEMRQTGTMNEGVQSTRMGLRGIPHVAESIQLKRDIDILRYTESRLHVVGLSTAEGLKQVKAAKKEGLDITCEVHIANLVWTDEQVKDYDTNYKLMPPLRTEGDRKALIRGVNDGTIDCISSDHRPEDVEHKKVEFNRAAYGIAMIESFYAHYQTYLSDDISLERFIECITTGPCAVLGLTPASIAEGRPAIVTCFTNKEAATTLPRHTKAYNTPCIPDSMRGRVIGTWR